MKINERLIAVQSELHAPKGQTNSFGKYKYRSCEDILEAVKPICISKSLLLTLSDSMIAIHDRVYVMATATVSDGENEISVSAYAREAETKKGMDDAQITGAASSYARKYALNGLFCIDDTKDADATNKHDDKPKPAPKQPDQTAIEYLSVFEACENLGELQQKFTDLYKKNPGDRDAIITAKNMRKEKLTNG